MAECGERVATWPSARPTISSSRLTIPTAPTPSTARLTITETQMTSWLAATADAPQRFAPVIENPAHSAGRSILADTADGVDHRLAPESILRTADTRCRGPRHWSCAGVVIPYPFQDFAALDGPSRVVHENTQQFKLGCGGQIMLTSARSPLDLHRRDQIADLAVGVALALERQTRKPKRATNSSRLNGSIR